RLVQLEETSYFLLVTLHHIVADAWSRGILLQEVSLWYDSLASGRGCHLPPLAAQYADFAAWQRQQSLGDLFATQIAYWRKQLDGCPPLLALPGDHPRPVAQTHLGAVHDFTIPVALTEALKALSRRERVTLFTTLLAAVHALLARLTGERDICIGTPTAGRS